MNSFIKPDAAKVHSKAYSIESEGFIYAFVNGIKLEIKDLKIIIGDTKIR
jgi:hypothetical protein